jgi:3-carboxymuconate cyclase
MKQGVNLGNTMVYVGSYSAPSGEGIYTFELSSQTGRLSQAFAPVPAENPSYLTLSGNRRYLYAVCETGDFQRTHGGGVAAYSIGGNGGLSFINDRPTLGIDPCYLSTNQGDSILAAANYNSGSLSVFPLGEDGVIEPCRRVEVHTGNGPNRERQEMPHVHFTQFTPDGKYLCVVDLGIDKVRFYRYDTGTNSLHAQEELEITLRPGSGPRHVVFREGETFVYVITELSCEVAVFRYDGSRYRELQVLSTLPPDFTGTNTAAAVRLSPDGKFLYASNRGHDSIACYQIEGDGMLSLRGIYSVHGIGPRDFAIEPQGNYLLSANERSDEIVVFKIDRETGALTPTGIREKVHSPTCIRFLPMDGTPD